MSMFLFLFSPQQEEMIRVEAEKYVEAFDVKLNAAMTICKGIINDSPRKNPTEGFNIYQIRDLIVLLIRDLKMVEHGCAHRGDLNNQILVHRIIVTCQSIIKRMSLHSKPQVIEEIKEVLARLIVLEQRLLKSFPVKHPSWMKEMAKREVLPQIQRVKSSKPIAIPQK